MTSTGRKIKHGFWFRALVPIDIENMSEEGQKKVALDTLKNTVFKENKNNHEMLVEPMITEPDGEAVSLEFVVWYIVSVERDFDEIQELFREKYIKPMPAEWKVRDKAFRSDFL